MSTFSTNLYIELIGTGEQTGTWGGTTNNTWVYAIEEPIVGRATVAFTDANVTLTPIELNTNQIFRNLYLNCTGTNTTTRSLIVPTINKNYYIENNTNQSLLVKTAAGTGITVLSGYICAVYINGTDVIQAANYQPVMTVGTLALTNSLTTASGGTGLASYTAGDTLYYSAGTTLSKLGIGATGTVLTVAGGVPTWSAIASSFSAGTTGFTPSSATTGAITLAGTLNIANGGTGSTSTTYCALATNVSGTLPVANGGTGVTSSTGTGAVVLGTNPSLTNPTVTSYIESVVAIGTVTSASTISLTSGTVQTATLTSATPCTFTMPTATAGKSFVMLLKQPAAGTATTATFTGVKYGNAGAPVITATVGKMDILSFIADGTNWYGSTSQGYTP
jgi:hypothetical protein